MSKKIRLGDYRKVFKGELFAIGLYKQDSTDTIALKVFSGDSDSNEWYELSSMTMDAHWSLELQYLFSQVQSWLFSYARKIDRGWEFK